MWELAFFLFLPLLRVGSGGVGMSAGVAEEGFQERRGFERQDAGG